MTSSAGSQSSQRMERRPVRSSREMGHETGEKLMVRLGPAVTEPSTCACITPMAVAGDAPGTLRIRKSCA